MKEEYDFRRGGRGPVAPTPSGKTRITIRIDDDVLECSASRFAPRAAERSHEAILDQDRPDPDAPIRADRAAHCTGIG